MFLNWFCCTGGSMYFTIKSKIKILVFFVNCEPFSPIQILFNKKLKKMHVILSSIMLIMGTKFS